jgi:hypothetical protein
MLFVDWRLRPSRTNPRTRLDTLVPQLSANPRYYLFKKAGL